MSIRRNLWIWLLFCLLAGGVLLVYTLTSLAHGRGAFVLPLDDVYIHFQYAKQLASGQPYVYNPGQPPTSGATSFLYPYILAFGYLIGFQGLNLSLWAMIVGALALLGSLWLVYRLVKAHAAPVWLAVMTALIFGFTGSVQWHFMSGMETGIVILLVLATLYGVVTHRLRWFVISASLLTLTRPEGGVLAGIGVIAFWFDMLRAQHTAPLRKRRWLLLIPILAVFVQPLVNWLVTGSAVATGNSAKSILGTVPFYWDVVIGRILENFARMWAEFITGVSPREGLYVPYLVGPLALAFLIGGLFSRKFRLVNAMLLLWLLAGTASIATLDTSFWHFKRYQMPLIALLFPLAGWAVTWIILQRKGAQVQGKDGMGGRTQPAASLQYVVIGLAGAGLVVALTTAVAFRDHFALNVDYVYQQPLQMAHWLQANTPEDAVVAVHDVGMMRYMGERTTLDMVGLTTPGAAAYWRNGPGSIAEFLIQERPDYIASYGKGHGLGLELIANTRIYGDPLAEFSVELDPHYNVALAADYQGIYQPDWTRIVPGPDDTDPQTIWIDVANIESETAVDYAWHNRVQLAGFPTIAQELTYSDCVSDCVVTAGFRRLNGEERFSVPTLAGQPFYLLTAVHSGQRATLDVYVNDVLVDRNWIPERPGWMVTIPTWVAAEYVTADSSRIRIVSDGLYEPLWHTVKPEDRSPETAPDNAIATYQNGAFELADYIQHMADANRLELGMHWYSRGDTEGDYRFFAHLYDDVNQPPIAQYDNYPGDGTMPPGNWPPGLFYDEASIDISTVPPGTHRLAIGFYNPYTGERLLPESDVYEVSADGRLWLDDVDIPAAEE